jgi:CRISPR/Cas system-associated endoribonuclease Cas2
MDGIEYHVHSLSALADRFDDYAEMTEQNLDRLQYSVLEGSRDAAIQCAAIATIWRVAANIVRHTVLTPPKSAG